MRQLAKESGLQKNDVERGLKRFFEVKILRQEVRHTKTIITITHQETYDLIKSFSETKKETKVRQERDKSETQKDTVDTLDKEKQQQQGESCFADFAAAFYERLKEIPLSQEDIILFSQDEYSQDRVDLAIDYIKTKIEEGKKPDSIIATLRWHCKLPKPPKANSKKSTEQQEEAEIFNKFLLDHGFIELHEINKLSILKNVAWIILSRMPTSISLLNLSTEIKKDFEQSKREILNDKQRKRECQSHTI